MIALRQQHRLTCKEFKMYTSSTAIEVNSATDKRLTASEIWRQLLVKAANPIGIVPGVKKSEILEEYPDGFLRRMEIGGETIIERITLTPEVQVLFTRVDSPGNEGYIANTLSNLNGNPILVFTGAVNFAGTQPGSAEEQVAGKRLDAGYREAMQNVISRAREIT